MTTYAVVCMHASDDSVLAAQMAVTGKDTQ